MTNKEEIRILLNQAEYAVSILDFNTALELYSEIAERYEHLPKKVQDFIIQNKYNNFNKTMLVYLRLRECKLLMQPKYINLLLTKLKDLTFDVYEVLSDHHDPKFIEYVEREYNNIIHEYNKMTSKYNFDIELKEIQYYLKMKMPDQALTHLKEFQNVYTLAVINQDYDKRKELINKFRIVYDNVLLQDLKEQAYSEVAKVNPRTKKIKRNILVPNRIVEGSDMIHFDQRFEEVNRLVKKNEVDKAMSLLSSL